MAQRLAHFLHTEGVIGSIPISPTICLFSRYFTAFFFLFIDVRALKLRERHDLFSAFCTIFRSNMVQKAEVFPEFVRNLGGIWYKVRKYRSRRLAAEFRKAGNKRPRAIAPGLCLLVYSYLARTN